MMAQLFYGCGGSSDNRFHRLLFESRTVRLLRDVPCVRRHLDAPGASLYVLLQLITRRYQRHELLAVDGDRTDNTDSTTP